MRALLLLLLPLAADASIQRVPPLIIRPAGSHAPGTVLGSDGQPMRRESALIIPEGVSREAPRILDQHGNDARSRPLVIMPEKKALVTEAPKELPPASELSAEGAATVKAVEDAKKPTALQELKTLLINRGILDNDRRFAGVEDEKLRGELTEKLDDAAKLEAGPRAAAVRALFMKHGDRLDWDATMELLTHLPADSSVRKEIMEAFLAERRSSMTERQVAVAKSILDKK